MTVLYVYYKVQGDQAALLWPAVKQMQAQLRSAMPGLAASLNQRVPPASMPTEATPAANTPFLEGPLATWMEIYHINGHADHRAWQRLEQALAQAAALLPAGMEGSRHCEWFDRLG